MLTKNLEENYALIQIAIIFHVYFLFFNPFSVEIKGDLYESIKKNDFLYIITFMIVFEYNVKERVVTSIVKYFFSEYRFMFRKLLSIFLENLR